MLFSGTEWGKTLYLLKRGMDVAVIRREVIADNIANVDTPNFRRQEVTFESQLKRALESEKESETPARLTDKRHIPFKEVIDYRNVKARIIINHDRFYRNDKNGIDIDQEMAQATKNAMRYNAFVDVYSREIKKIDLILR